MYRPGGVGDFLFRHRCYLRLAFARPAKTRMVNPRTIALRSSSNLICLIFIFFFSEGSLVKMCDHMRLEKREELDRTATRIDDRSGMFWVD